MGFTQDSELILLLIMSGLVFAWSWSAFLTSLFYDITNEHNLICSLTHPTHPS